MPGTMCISSNIPPVPFCLVTDSALVAFSKHTRNNATLAQLTRRAGTHRDDARNNIALPIYPFGYNDISSRGWPCVYGWIMSDMQEGRHERAPDVNFVSELSCRPIENNRLLRQDREAGLTVLLVCDDQTV